VVSQTGARRRSRFALEAGARYALQRRGALRE
jgi:hypothetical protein